MKPLCISIDVEPDLHTLDYNSVKELASFLKLLEKYNIKATFFITCDCLLKNQKIFKEIKKQNHEISLHGYKHERIAEMPTKEKQENISKSLQCFKKYLNIKPIGFRAPQHSIDNEMLNILEKNNFTYDSSIIPWNFYHFLFFWKIKLKFSDNFASMKIHKIKNINNKNNTNNLLEVPISSFILPFSSVTLRILPKFLLKPYFHLINCYKNPVFLMHSWDLIEIPNSKLYNLCPKDKFLEKLDIMFNFFSNRRKLISIREII